MNKEWWEEWQRRLSRAQEIGEAKLAEERFQRAVHEAAHAVVAINHGIRFGLVTIEPRVAASLTADDAVELRHSEGGLEGVELPDPNDAVTRLGLRLTAVAGLVADGASDHGAFPSDDRLKDLATWFQSDQRYSADFRTYQVASSGESVDLMDQIRAASLLLEGSWGDVDRLAHALVAATTLTFDEVLDRLRAREK